MRRAATLLLTASLAVTACTSDDPTMGASPPATASPDTDPTDGPTTAGPSDDETGSQVGTQAELELTATLTGAAAVPGPGDPSGSGSFQATIILNESAGELCYQLEVADVTSEVTAAHIHAGAEGEAGAVHVALSPPVEGPVDECVAVNASELVPIMDDPAQFYVNVHSQGHPDSAVRGQLQGE